MEKDYKHIKILIVGKSPYDPTNGKYRNLKYCEVFNFIECGIVPSIEKNCSPAKKCQKPDYESNELEKRLKLFDDIAFVPITKGDYSEWNIKVYVRILAFLRYTFMNKGSFKIPLENPQKELKEENEDILPIISCLVEQGIYLVNKTELDNKKAVKKLQEQNHIKYICFGNDAADFIKSKIFNANDKYKEICNVIEYPHPSPQVNHPFWDQLIKPKRKYDDLERAKKLCDNIDNCYEDLRETK